VCQKNSFENDSINEYYYKIAMLKGIIIIVCFILYSSISPAAESSETHVSEIKEKKLDDKSISAAVFSTILGPGTGEWLVNDTQNFTQCLIEHLILLIPIIGLFNWIGSVKDAYNKEPEPQANWLFTTMDLRPTEEMYSTSPSD